MNTIISICIMGAGLFLYALLVVIFNVKKKKENDVYKDGKSTPNVLSEDEGVSKTNEVQTEPAINTTPTPCVHPKGVTYFRVTKEREALANSIAALSTFTISDGFKCIDSVQAMLLLQQLQHMNAYHQVLHARLERMQQSSNIRLGE